LAGNDQDGFARLLSHLNEDVYARADFVFYTPSLLRSNLNESDDYKAQFAKALQTRIQTQKARTKIRLFLSATGIQSTVPNNEELRKKWLDELKILTDPETLEKCNMETYVLEDACLPSVSLVFALARDWSRGGPYDIWFEPRVGITKKILFPKPKDERKTGDYAPMLDLKECPKAIQTILKNVEGGGQPLGTWIVGHGKEFTLPVPSLAILSAMRQEIQYYAHEGEVIRERTVCKSGGHRGFLKWKDGIRGAYLPNTGYGRLETNNVVSRTHEEFPSVDEFIFVGCAGGPGNIGDVFVSGEIYDQCYEKIERNKKKPPSTGPKPYKQETVAIPEYKDAVVKSESKDIITKPRGRDTITIRAELFTISKSESLYVAAENLFNSQSSDREEWKKIVTKYSKMALETVSREKPERTKDAIRLQEQLTTKLPEIKFGRLWSSDHNVNEKWFRDELIHGFQVQAFEMEGGGLARAATRIGKAYIEIRAISDRADGTRDDDLNQPFAFAIASACLEWFLSIRSGIADRPELNSS
jgi:nucleoside phosphorylase